MNIGLRNKIGDLIIEAGQKIKAGNSNITEDEAIQLIEDIYGKNNITYPYTPYWSQITYDAPDFSKFEITCNKIK